MNEIIQEDPVTASIDRRSALKKVAIGGAIAWSAPTLMSSRASASEVAFCTPKCFYTSSITISGTVKWLGCDSNPPGQQGMFFEVNLGEASATASCPCGTQGGVVSVVSPSGSQQGYVPAPGNGGNFEVEGYQFPIVIEIRCEDGGGGEVLVSRCTGTGTVSCPQVGDCSGNCQSLPKKDTSFTATIAACSAFTCNGVPV